MEVSSFTTQRVFTTSSSYVHEINVNRVIHNYYLSTSLFTFIGSLFVIFSYFFNKDLQKHPSALFFYRSCFNFLVSLALMIQIADSNIEEKCHSHTPFLFFTLLGSQIYFFGSIFDLYISLKNPLMDPAANVKFVHVGAFCFASIAAFIISVQDLGAYSEDLQLCWIKATSGGALSINFWTWAFFYIPTGGIVLSAIYVVITASSKLSVGLPETYELRMRALWDALYYTASFTIYWFIVGILYVALINAADEDKEDPVEGLEVLQKLFAFSVGLLGVGDSLTWFFRKFLFRADKTVINKNISNALIMEIVRYTSYGLTESIKEARKTNPEMPTTFPAERFFPTNLKDEESGITAIPLNHPDVEGGGTVEFFDYAPEVFRYQRKCALDLDDDVYLDSVGYDKERMDKLVNKFSEGKSGSFFYFSHDSKYVVKTLVAAEAEYLLKVLKRYVEHITSNSNTLINKIIGLHAIRFYGSMVYFVVMENIFLAELQPHEKYDIKGSWVARSTELRFNSKKLMKDNDFHRQLIMRPKMKDMFLRQIDSDTKFLRDLNIMDYSLLLGIYYMKINIKSLTQRNEKRHMKLKPEQLHKEPSNISQYRDGPDDFIPETKTEILKPGGPSLIISDTLRSTDDFSPPPEQGKTPRTTNTMFKYRGGIESAVIEGPGIYYVGIIDILQEWNLSKKVERFFKTYFMNLEAAGISAIEPSNYQTRFMEKMVEITMSDMDFYKEAKIDVEEMNSQAFAVHIHPTPADVQDNMEMARNATGSVSPNHHPDMMLNKTV